VQPGARHRVRQSAELEGVMWRPRVRCRRAGMESRADAWAVLKATSGL
jgi:hypothetical protein